MDTAKLIIEYQKEAVHPWVEFFKILLSAPAITGYVVFVFIWLFKTQIRERISKIDKVKGPGGIEATIGQGGAAEIENLKVDEKKDDSFKNDLINVFDPIIKDKILRSAISDIGGSITNTLWNARIITSDSKEEELHLMPQFYLLIQTEEESFFFVVPSQIKGDIGIQTFIYQLRDVYRFSKIKNTRAKICLTFFNLERKNLVEAGITKDFELAVKEGWIQFRVVNL